MTALPMLLAGGKAGARDAGPDGDEKALYGDIKVQPDGCKEPCGRLTRPQ